MRHVQWADLERCEVRRKGSQSWVDRKFEEVGGALCTYCRARVAWNGPVGPHEFFGGKGRSLQVAGIESLGQ